LKRGGVVGDQGSSPKRCRTVRQTQAPAESPKAPVDLGVHAVRLCSWREIPEASRAQDDVAVL